MAAIALSLACAFAAAASADTIKISVPSNYAASGQAGTVTLSGTTSASREADLYADAQPCASSDVAEGHHTNTLWWGNRKAGRIHGTFKVVASFPYPSSLRTSRFYFCAYVEYSNGGVISTTAHASLA